MKLYEKWRPTEWADVIGQDKAVAALDAVRESEGFGGNAIFITGASGTGKTTLARLIAGEIADRFWVTELDAQELSMDRLRKIEQGQYQYGGGKGGRAVIVNEAHGLRADVIRKLLCMLEAIPGHVTWVFTTTHDGADKLFGDQIDAHPLLSRCHAIRLTTQGLAQPFAAFLKRVAKSEGLDGQPVARYVRLLAECHNNLREAFEVIAAGGMTA